MIRNMKMKTRILTTVCACSLSGLAAGADKSVLWPGDPAAELKAQPSSTVTLTADGVAVVETGTEYPWPGARLDFKGERDLSGDGEIAIAVTNLTDRPCLVSLSVKSRALQGRSPGGGIDLQPFASGTIRVDLRPMPWVLDAPLKLSGMNGYPSAENGQDHLFDIRRTTSLHIFRGGESRPARFGIVSVSAGAAAPVARKTLCAKTFLPFVDRFGQFRHDDWPGKVHDEAELAKTRADEADWLKAHADSPIPGADRFGGWAAGPQLKATGFFRTEKVNGKWWLVDPDGRLFFSHGVDCVNHGEGVTGVGFRENYFEDLPPKDDPVFGPCWGLIRYKAAHGFYAETNHLPYATYNIGMATMIRKYGAGWSEIARDLAHRRIRAWGLNTIANWSSPYVYALRRTQYTLCLGKGGAPRRKGSKGWWGPLPDPFDPKFEQVLRERAKKAAKTMRDDPWCLGVFVDNELSWNDLPDLADVAEKYFTVVSTVLHEELPNHLYLGCRIAWGPACVYRAAARHCDVVSVNVYSRQPDRDLPQGCVDKPLINGEFHFGALDRGMFHTGLVATRDQAERAACYRAYVNACLDHPRFVGTHWFQWKDQPLTGRADGENYQIGFLTITDTPYPELVEAAREVAAGMYARRYGEKK